MKRKCWLLVCLIGMALLTVYCGNGQEDPPEANGKTELAGTYQSKNPVIVLDDGQTLVGNEQIIAEFRKRAENNPEATYQISILGNEVPQLLDSNGGMSPNGIINLPYNYNVVFGAHYGYVSGWCIKRNIYHVNFLINKKGITTPITDLHIGSWRENGRICVGIYVSPQGWCTKICSPSFSDIAGGIAAALIAVGITAYIAWAIAYILTPIACGLLLI